MFKSKLIASKIIGVGAKSANKNIRLEWKEKNENFYKNKNENENVAFHFAWNIYLAQPNKSTHATKVCKKVIYKNLVAKL